MEKGKKEARRREEVLDKLIQGLIEWFKKAGIEVEVQKEEVGGKTVITIKPVDEESFLPS